MSFMPDDPTVFTVEIGGEKPIKPQWFSLPLKMKEDVFVLENTVSFNTGETVKRLKWIFLKWNWEWKRH